MSAERGCRKTEKKERIVDKEMKERMNYTSMQSYRKEWKKTEGEEREREIKKPSMELRRDCWGRNKNK